MSVKKNSALGLALFAGLVMSGCTASVTSSHKTDPYLYEDTRRLVDFVEGAAALIEQRGTAAFDEFGRAGSRWQSFSTYLFVYDDSGTCVWHGLNPELVGRNLISLHDALGKPVIQSMVAITKRPERDASGWVFYLWEERTDLLPAWKSSYVRKAVAPDGKTYFVGSGSGRLKVEKVFVQDRVEHSDMAWVQFLWPKPGERLPSRKLMYVRKIRAGGEVLLVGSDFYLATPIWMKS